MNASRRLYTQFAESAAEASSSWSRLLSPKEVIVTGSTLGAAFVLVNQWATGVQLEAFKEVVHAELKTELGAMRNNVKTALGAMRNDMMTELVAVRNDMKAELGAVRNDMMTELGAMLATRL